MKRYLALFLFILPLVGCATTEGYKMLMQSWVGSPESSLIASWGPPDSVYESGELKYLTYNRTSTGYMPGTAPTYTTNFIGNTAYTTSSGGSPGYAYTMQCKTTFTVEKKIIQNWRFDGNACKAKKPS